MPKLEDVSYVSPYKVDQIPPPPPQSSIDVEAVIDHPSSSVVDNEVYIVRSC